VLPDGGRIINIGSGIATRTGASEVADHAGTKAALAGFTRGAARDLAQRGNYGFDIPFFGWSVVKASIQDP
jgi:NAD(P)-dependent dehydrogenase (short-subunit alcohol dehydrogenase family)